MSYIDKINVSAKMDLGVAAVYTWNSVNFRYTCLRSEISDT